MAGRKIRHHAPAAAPEGTAPPEGTGRTAGTAGTDGTGRTGRTAGTAGPASRRTRWRRGLGGAVVAHVQTWRPYTLAHPALVGVAGASSAGGGHRPGVLGLAAGAPALGWLAGHYLGDWFDRELDAIAKPQRPIPSGRLSPGAALAGGTACAAGAALILAVVNWRTLLLFVVAMAGIVAYSRFCKGRGISGNAVRGVLTALAFAVGAMLARSDPPARAFAPALVFLLHDTSSNLVGTIRDVDGDRAGGYLSVPVRRGVGPAARLAAALYAGAVAVAVAVVVLLPTAHPGACAVLLGVAAAVALAAFGPLLRGTRPAGPAGPGPGVQRTALRAHEVLVVERLVLTAAVVAAGAGAPVALCLLAPLLAFSVVTQAVMRARHELPPPAAAQAGDARGPGTSGTDRKAYQP
ncbi:putative UbiA prenyltransferase [Actinacidiphila reveromycinica]|uniref:Putative UbiA prenyltransferase n=1 Tax=Actinacidiphila reveromycinica TaxID=659352 RepID=A0A7U3UZ18_9ACTN|nr:UbiA family prenyltransferase [Streptomyces sp. SN-593]BBB01325.1 putative UbiA prenyltransferase [Streptomyces sp. SN-593]